MEVTTKKEIGRLTSIDVFKKSHNSEWAEPMFVQPKKTGEAGILMDFQNLNLVLKQKLFHYQKYQTYYRN